MLIPGGVAGDVATVASLINAIPRVLEAEPGLKTVLDLPIPRAFWAG
jgi:4-hydroxy-tetrahydrodipicolinate reductase